MVTGRNWTRRSIEELVEAYMKKHGGGSVDPAVLNAKLTLPNIISYGYLNVSSAPSGYSKGVAPVYSNGMHLLKFQLVNSDGETYSQLGLGIETYDAMQLEYATDAVFTDQLYPWRYGIDRNNTPANIRNTYSMQTFSNHLIFLVSGTANKPILRCPANAYISWTVSSLSGSVVSGVTIPSMVSVAGDNLKMKALRDALVAKEADIAQAMDLSGTLPLSGVKAYCISTDSLSLAGNELICKLLETLFPPSTFDPASVIDFTL